MGPMVMLFGLLLTTTGCAATADECEPGALGCACLAGGKCNDNQTCRWGENDPIAESAREPNEGGTDFDPSDPCGAKNTTIVEALDTIPAGFNLTVEQMLLGMEGDKPARCDGTDPTRSSRPRMPGPRLR